jgi:Bacterial SH3 domain
MITAGWGVVAGVALAVSLAACGSSGHQANPPPPTTTATTVAPTTTTLPGVQSSGARTVLSPIGLNVRAQPAKTAKVLGTAAEGVALTVLGYRAADGGWYEVRGATVTGWISASNTLSAPGTFQPYSSSALGFASLYPTGWTVKASPSAAVFRAPIGGDTITVTAGPTTAQLGRGQAGYALSRSEQVVVCGVTGDLDTYTDTTAANRYLAQVLLTLDAKHALAINGSVPGSAQVQTVLNFANSVTFPFPQCQGK